MQFDYTRRLAQQIETLTNKLEKLNVRVKALEQALGERDSRRSPGISALSPDRVKQLKESVIKP